MADLFLLPEAQMRRIEPYFLLSHGVSRVDDRLVISGIVLVIRNELRWRDALPPAKKLLGDKGYDAVWFRQSLAARGVTACIPSKSNRKTTIEHDRVLYRERHKIEICSAGSRTGGASMPATINALIPSSAQSASQP